MDDALAFGRQFRDVSLLRCGQFMKLNQFRVRRLTLTLPALPASLDGMTIAHVSDTHVGRLTRGPILDAVVRTTNDLEADRKTASAASYCLEGTRQRSNGSSGAIGGRLECCRSCPGIFRRNRSCDSSGIRHGHHQNPAEPAVFLTWLRPLSIPHVAYDKEKAEADLKSAKDFFSVDIPTDSNALNLYQKGVAAAKKNDNKAAAQFFSDAVTAYPNFPIALGDLGMMYVKLNQMDKAGDTFEELVKLKPADPMAHLNLGIVRYNQKKFDEAETHLRKALDLKSAGPMAHYYLGLTLVNLKRHGEALPEFEATVANGGENIALAHRYLGGLNMSQNKTKEAADELEKYLNLDPKAPDAERIKGTIKDLRSKQ